jgi:hypothetical protein
MLLAEDPKAMAQITPRLKSRGYSGALCEICFAYCGSINCSHSGTMIASAA